MGNTSAFKLRYQYWKETGELPYQNGIKRNLQSNLVGSSSVESGILPGYDGGKDGRIKLPTITRYKEINPQTSIDGSWSDTIDFITGYEGTHMDGGYHTAYQKKNDKPTIGYGTTDPKWVSKGRITEKEARQAMYEDLLKNEAALRKNFKGYDDLPGGAKMVLRDILYNVGPGTLFNNSPKFMAAMRNGDWAEAGRQMDWGNNQTGFSNGLRKRNVGRQEVWRDAFNIKNTQATPTGQSDTYVRQLFQPPTIKVPVINNEYNPQPHHGNYSYIDRNSYPQPNPIQTWEYLGQGLRMFRQRMLNNIQQLIK